MSQISIIVAMNQDKVIGKDNQLPWHIPEDLAYFKNLTYGKPIIMGRKTYESIGRVLPGRKNIVISRNRDLLIDGVTIYSNLELAILDNNSVDELFVIGGSEIFKQALPIATKLYLTIVDFAVKNNFDAGSHLVFFKELDLSRWSLVKSSKIVSNSGISCSFNEYINK